MTLLLIYLAIAIGVSFICSMLEAVFLSITPSYIEGIADDDSGGAEVVRSVKDRLDQSLASILILNTFAHTMGAAGVGAQATKVFGVKWETFIAVVLTLTILYLSEIIPKTLGATYWRQLAVPASRTINVLIKLVYPLIWISGFITKVFKKEGQNEVSRDEIIALASLSHKTGSLIGRENEYLANVLKLRDVRTEQILTPRVVMHCLSDDISVDGALNDEKTLQYSRIPLFQGSRDNITGLVNNRALLIALRNGDADAPLSQYSRPITRVSVKLPVQQLIDLFLKKKEMLFLVEDQYGQTEGIVSLEDAIETMLGREIVDENDTVEDLQALAKTNYRNKQKQGES